MPPCDGGPTFLASMTELQCERQAYDMLGALIDWMARDNRRHVGLKMENDQLKIGISAPVRINGKTHHTLLNRTVDPQQARPVRWTPELCRQMGGAALVTIVGTFAETLEAARQKES